MRRPRPPLPVPSGIPVRARGVHGRRGHRGIIPDDPDTPTVACVAPAEPWHLHRTAAEITPDCPDCCLRTLRSIERRLLGLSRRSMVACLSPFQCGRSSVRVEVRRSRRSESDRLPRAPALAAPLLWAHSWRQWSGSLCLPLSPTHSSSAQVDQTTWLATSWPVRRCRARRTAREARRERVRLCECARDGGAGQGSSQGLLCALCVAYVGHFGRGRSARAEAVTVVCGTPRAAAVVASAVARHAFRSHDPGRPAGTDGRAGRPRV